MAELHITLHVLKTSVDTGQEARGLEATGSLHLVLEGWEKTVFIFS
jgi:hypothetical protein